MELLRNIYSISPKMNVRRKMTESLCIYTHLKLAKALINKEKAIIADGLSSVATLFLERCSCNTMIKYVTIRKLIE
jgi:hypothetical protein